MKKFRCSICGYSNDPKRYAMRKIGKRWYHLICIDKVISFVLFHYDVKVEPTDMFRIVKFEEKELSE